MEKSTKEYKLFLAGVLADLKAKFERGEINRDEYEKACGELKKDLSES